MADRLDVDDPVDKLILSRMAEFEQDGNGYLAIQNTRPQTIGYGLVDSPVLQLAWIAEKFDEWTALPIDRDLLLTTVSLYWFTGSGVTAAHTLYDQAHSSEWGEPGAVPEGYAVFGTDETVRRVLPVADDAHWTEFPHALHFPSMYPRRSSGSAEVLRRVALSRERAAQARPRRIAIDRGRPDDATGGGRVMSRRLGHLPAGSTQPPSRIPRS
ncbi:hypothetical protein ACIGO9_31160 [Nocardia asteroides]|uniref:hypothetical protein n=1 Tax=Nocardia asteroides TaxID=1824 RepID=UPI0037CC4591